MKYNDKNPPIICMQTNSTCYKQTRIMDIKGVLWHCTGANNPYLKRYIQPLPSDENYDYLIQLLGVNKNGNDYNHTSYQSGLNAWIGKTQNGEVMAVQSMPWEYQPWGCGTRTSGGPSCNRGWIQFECNEDSLTDENYFNQIYKEGCELTAYLCKKYNLDPHGSVLFNGKQVPVILCHQDSYQLGFGSNHGDIYNWFNKYGKTMEDVRNDVAALMNEKEDEEEMTQEQFNVMMNNWIAETALAAPSDWSAEARNWAESNGILQGDENGNKQYKRNLTREEFITVLHRLYKGEKE